MAKNDLFKLFEKPLVLGLYKRTRESAMLVKDEKGKIVNEGQTLKFVTLKAFQDDIKGLRDMGYSIINVVSYGDADKETIDAVIEGLKDKKTIVKDSIVDTLLKQNEELLKRLEELEKGAKLKDEQKENQK